MRITVLTNSCIKTIVNSLAIDDQIRELLNKCTQTYGPGYVHFLHSLFNESSGLYQPVLGQDSYLGVQPAEEIIEKFQTTYKNILNGKRLDYGSTFVADKLDVIYGISCTGQGRASKFNDQVYEDLYNTLEEITDKETAAVLMEEVFDAVENLMACVESIVMRKSLQEEQMDTANVSVHVTIHQDSLLVAVY